MNNSISLVLPWPVSANRYWRTAVIRGRSVTYVSAEAKAYKQAVAAIVRQAGVIRPFPRRVKVDFRLYPARPKDWAARQRKDPQQWDDSVRCLDLDNIRKVVNDSLKGLVFLDDGWPYREDSSRRMEPDEHGARVEVTITPLVTEKAQGGLF